MNILEKENQAFLIGIHEVDFYHMKIDRQLGSVFFF